MNEEEQRPEIVEPDVVRSIVEAEIDVQIATAKKYPRNVARSIDRAIKLACQTVETAEECHYSIPRAGKNIEGPSVRLAEILGSTWGNLRTAARVISKQENVVVAQGTSLDLETNFAVQKEAELGILTSDGRRYSADMIKVTSNAAGSIAIRNSLFTCVPKAIWIPVYDKVLETIHGGKVPIGQRRTAVLQWFGARGVDEDVILAFLELKKVGDIEASHIVRLAGVRNAISEQQTTIEETFGIAAPAQKPKETKQSKPQSRPAPPREVPPEPKREPISVEEESKRADLYTAVMEVTAKLKPTEVRELKEKVGIKNINTQECTSEQLEQLLGLANEMLKE